jgi:hypothetical protein
MTILLVALRNFKNAPRKRIVIEIPIDGSTIHTSGILSHFLTRWQYRRVIMAY